MMRIGRATALGGLAVAVVVACYAPTEVRLQISTDHACLAQQSATDAAPNASKRIRTLIQLGASPTELDEGTETDRCEGDGDIGSLVLLPRDGKRDARATVQVTMTRDGSNPALCNDPKSFGEQCIVTRRTFSFIEHTSRVVPIRLYEACKGVPCGPDRGCDALGVCTFADVDLGCEGSSDPRCDAGAPVDAAGALVDAPVAFEAGKPDATARPACTGQLITPNEHELALSTSSDITHILVGNTTRLFWPGGSKSNEVHTILKDGSGSVTQLAGNNAWGVIRALAADEDSVWLATDTKVARIDLSKNTARPNELDFADVHAIALRPLGKPLLLEVYFSVLAGADKYDLFRLDQNGATTGPPVLVSTGRGGEQLFVAGSIVYAINNSGPAIYRTDVMSTDPPPSAMTLGAPVTGAAFWPSALFFAENRTISSPAGKLRRLDTTIQELPVMQLTAPGQVGVDDAFVYYVDQGAPTTGVASGPAALKRRGTLPIPLSNTPPPDVASGFDSISGLVLDQTPQAKLGCAYFWATKASGPTKTTTLYVYPKAP